MKRDELSGVLFKNIRKIKYYPDKVKEVKDILNITAFFPRRKRFMVRR